jgi:hypothetical protein
MRFRCSRVAGENSVYQSPIRHDVLLADLNGVGSAEGIRESGAHVLIAAESFAKRRGEPGLDLIWA